MKLTALATAILVMGCSGGSKTATKPTPPTGDGATGDVAATGDTGATGQTEMAKPPVEPPPPDTGGFQLIAPEDLKYAPLDPTAAGGPELAVLHGDPQSGGAFFLKIPAGGKSGLHTHTADYQAVVLSGAPKHWLVGDKKAKPLAAGSHWFQPGGQPHADECTGTEPCVLFIVMPGAFDFTATPKAKKGKPGKYKLIPRKDDKFVPLDPTHPEGIKAAFVFGDPKTGPVGFVIEVPPGANSGLHSHTANYHAVALDGAPAHWLPHEKGEGEPLGAGTYWFQPGGYDHGDRCTSAEACHSFVFVEGPFDFKPATVK